MLTTVSYTREISRHKRNHYQLRISNLGNQTSPPCATLGSEVWSKRDIGSQMSKIAELHVAISMSPLFCTLSSSLTFFSSISSSPSYRLHFGLFLVVQLALNENDLKILFYSNFKTFTCKNCSSFTTSVILRVPYHELFQFFLVFFFNFQMSDVSVDKFKNERWRDLRRFTDTASPFAHPAFKPGAQVCLLFFFFWMRWCLQFL